MDFASEYVQQTGGKGKGHCLNGFTRGGLSESV